MVKSWKTFMQADIAPCQMRDKHYFVSWASVIMFMKDNCASFISSPYMLDPGLRVWMQTTIPCKKSIHSILIFNSIAFAFVIVINYSTLLEDLVIWRDLNTNW